MVRPEGTESFKFNHTMLRVKDPKASLKFYQDVVGESRLACRHALSSLSGYSSAVSETSALYIVLKLNILVCTGMELIDKHEASDFTLYFLAFPLPE